MHHCMILIVLSFSELCYTFWPASYRVDFKDQKTFVITAGENEDDEDENENEMIQPEDLAVVSPLANDEDRYKALHSHVEHYNRRAAESEMQSDSSNPNLQINIEEMNPFDEEKPFVAGFKHELDEYNLEMLSEKGSSVFYSGVTPQKMIKRSIENNLEAQETIHSMNRSNRNEDETTDQSEINEIEVEAYDYEIFRGEYEQQLEEAKINNLTFNYMNNSEPEETAKDALMKILEFDVPKNCTKEELTKFGAKALECLAFDYQHSKNKTDVRRVLARTWNVIRVWICIYICIAIPCWFQKGWCCCCFRCSICFPDEVIIAAKNYYAENPPGILFERPDIRKESDTASPINYKATLFELDAYEDLESAIRNL